MLLNDTCWTLILLSKSKLDNKSFRKPALNPQLIEVINQSLPYVPYAYCTICHLDICWLECLSWWTVNSLKTWITFLSCWLLESLVHNTFSTNVCCIGLSGSIAGYMSYKDSCAPNILWGHRGRTCIRACEAGMAFKRRWCLIWFLKDK